MRISQEADYAIRMVGYLSSIGEPGKCDASKIAESVHVPKRFAVKILRKLNISGITKAYRGARGGYAVNRNPRRINFLEVVEAIDGPVCINRCLNDTAKCSDSRKGECPAHRRLGEINKVICKMLKETTFDEFC